jgi:hypothetical protein
VLSTEALSHDSFLSRKVNISFNLFLVLEYKSIILDVFNNTKNKMKERYKNHLVGLELCSLESAISKVASFISLSPHPLLPSTPCIPYWSLPIFKTIHHLPLQYTPSPRQLLTLPCPLRPLLPLRCLHLEDLIIEIF